MNIKRIVYMGTAPIAVPALQALTQMKELKVVAVCTQPDRPSGRKRRLTPSPVKSAALEHGLKVLDPEKIGTVETQLRELAPDLGIVFAYGQYLPSVIFDLPTYGSINFHPSRLPEYRGASPIQSTLLDGKTETALSVLQVGAKMDAGDIWMQLPVTIQPEENSETLHQRFGILAAQSLPDLINALKHDEVSPTPQDESRVIECGKISKQDGAVDWSLPASVLLNRIRAFQPWPGAFFPLNKTGNLKIQAAEIETGSGAPGEILDTTSTGPLVACGEDALRLIRVQPPGKKPMSGKEFLNGHPLEPGQLLASGPQG